MTLPSWPARSQDYKTPLNSSVRPQVPEIVIVLIDGNSTVCSDHNHVCVKNDEDMDKEQKVEMENIKNI